MNTGPFKIKSKIEIHFLIYLSMEIYLCIQVIVVSTKGLISKHWIKNV